MHQNARQITLISDIYCNSYTPESCTLTKLCQNKFNAILHVYAERKWIKLYIISLVKSENVHGVQSYIKYARVFAPYITPNPSAHRSLIHTAYIYMLSLYSIYLYNFIEFLHIFTYITNTLYAFVIQKDIEKIRAKMP